MLSSLKGELSSIGNGGAKSPDDTDSDMVYEKEVVKYFPMSLCVLQQIT